MQVTDSTLSESNFRTELINRFFHTNSYFFRCLNRELESVLADPDHATSEAYLLLGSLFDKLVASQNKLALLETLAKLDGFEVFNETLDHGIDFLRNSSSDCEKLKKEIEDLAQSIFDAAANALREEETRNGLRKILEPQERSVNGGTGRNLERSLPSVSAQSTTDREMNHQNEQENPKIVEPFSEVSFDAKTDLELESPLDFSDSEERDILRTDDDGMDACLYSGCDFDLTEENGSTDSKLDQDLGGDILGGEPTTFKEIFRTEIRRQLRHLHDVTASLERDMTRPNLWRDCDKIFDTIASQAMIYGFEPFEQIALKVRRFIATVLANISSYAAYGLELIEDTADALKAGLENDCDSIDDNAFRELAIRMSHPRKTAPKEKKARVTRSSSLDLEKSEHKNVGFSLPGEDDEEIVRLVNEISDNKRDKEGTEQTTLSDSADLSKSESATSHEVDFQAVPVTEVVSHLPDEQVNLFKEQAEFYFDVIEDALDKLKHDPQDKAALEDLELASHSLSGLTLKLSLEPLSKIPAAVEATVSKIISTETSMSERQQQIIGDLYHSFRKMNSLEDAESQEVAKLLASIQGLERPIPVGTVREESTSQHSQDHEEGLRARLL